jgi:hypothetical protein
MKITVKLLLPICAALLLTVAYQSCKKADINGFIKIDNDPIAVEKFLTAPSDSNPTVLRIINTVKHQEEKYPFLANIIAHEGYALWQHSHILLPSGAGKDTIVLVPLVFANTEYVNSFISCRVNDTVAIKLYKGREYATFGFGKSPDSLNANKIAFTCMGLEYETFKHSKFNIKDKRLFNYLPRDNEFAKNTLTIKPRPLRTWITVTFSYETEELYENPFDVWTPDGYASQWTHTVTHYFNESVWIADFGNWDGASFPDDPWATTGGQGGGNAYPPCGASCNAVVDSWQVVNDPPPLTPQEQQDLLWVNNSIKDSTNNPCVAQTLATLNQISSKLPALLRNVFDTTIAGQFNVTLKMYYVNLDEGASTAFNVSNLNYLTRINSRFQQATNLAVAATIIHEIFHCQLLAWYRQATVLNDTAKRNELARDYGYLFSKESVDYDNNLAAIVYNAMGASQHQDIAIRYRNTIGEALYQYAQAKGINVNLEFCKDLAWTGCQDSKAFNDLGLTGSAAILQLINSEKDPFGSVGVNGIPDSQKGQPCL